MVVYTNGESTVDAPMRWLYPEGEWPLKHEVEASLKGLNHFAWAIKEAAEEADLIHVNSAPGLSFSRFTDVPMVYTVHHAFEESLARVLSILSGCFLRHDQRLSAGEAQHAAHEDDSPRN